MIRRAMIETRIPILFFIENCSLKISSEATAVVKTTPMLLIGNTTELSKSVWLKIEIRKKMEP